MLAGFGLALSLAACGDAGSDDEGNDVEAEEVDADKFEDGTRRWPSSPMRARSRSA